MKDALNDTPANYDCFDLIKKKEEVILAKDY